MRLFARVTAEAWLTVVLLFVSLGGLLFMSSLVAKPKALFGRSLTAIEPSLFPKLVLIALAILSIWLFVTRRKDFVRSDENSVAYMGSIRALMLFAVMIFYALAMKPLGFLISSAISMAAISWLAGNRSIPVKLALSLISPVLLYIIATRGLAVSLPELSPIEFAYQHFFDLFSSNAATGAEQ